MAVLNELHEKMLRIILERSEIPDLANVSGGQNGLVTKTLKGLGSGDNFKVVEEYEVDCATVREIRALQEQVAEEVGQRVSRTEMLDLNRLFEKMSKEELEAYAREGTLPAWFPAGPQQGTSQYVSSGACEYQKHLFSTRRVGRFQTWEAMHLELGNLSGFRHGGAQCFGTY